MTVRYRFVTDVPVVGRLLADLDLEATATMRVETAAEWVKTAAAEAGAERNGK